MTAEPLSAYVRRTGCDEMSRDAIADRIAELEAEIAPVEKCGSYRGHRWGPLQDGRVRFCLDCPSIDYPAWRYERD